MTGRGYVRLDGESDGFVCSEHSRVHTHWELREIYKYGPIRLELLQKLQPRALPCSTTLCHAQETHSTFKTRSPRAHRISEIPKNSKKSAGNGKNQDLKRCMAAMYITDMPQPHLAFQKDTMLPFFFTRDTDCNETYISSIKLSNM